jgi:23S rRNA pseudouridine1911/1915/1917 synthase
MKNGLKTITVIEKFNQQRLDLFLTKTTNLSRSKIQKIIKTGGCSIDNKIITRPHLVVKTNEKIIIQTKPATEKTKGNVLPLNEPKILLATDDYLILDKPAGLMVHPADNNPQITLIDWLVKKYPSIKKVGENKMRPGIIHRLDKDVSGAMLIVLNQKTYKYFKKQFQEHAIKKTYTALVHGQLKCQEMLIDFPLVRSRRAGKIVAQPKSSQKGRMAQTLLTLIKQYQQTALVECQPITGRTHQIRVHCRAIGHPIVGDPIYGLKKTSINPQRIFLHSTKLEFTDNKNKKIKINCQLPTILKSFLLKLS